MRKSLSLTLMATMISLMPLMLAAPLAADAQTLDPASDLAQFRTYRAAGMAALDKHDTAAAQTALNQAGAILPDSPSILLLKAQLALSLHRKADARAALTDYLKRGYVVDLNTNDAFNAIWDAALEDLQQVNEGPVGDLFTVGTLKGFALADGLAYAPDSDQMFVSTLHTGKLVGLSPQGVRDIITFRPGVAAYGLGLRDRMIWATTAATRQTIGYDAAKPVRSKIVTIDPATGQVTGQFTDAVADRQFGHLLMGRDDLYAIDTTHGEVLRLPGYTGALQVLLPEGYMDSPSGLAESEDATSLLISDFVSGLYRIDLTTGKIVRLLPPNDGALLGISALSRYGHDLIAIQNGFKPARIVRLHMSADWREVQSVEVLLRAPKAPSYAPQTPSFLSQPTQGVVAQDKFIFVAKSQWDNLDAHGNAVSDTPDPVVIGALKLKP